MAAGQGSGQLVTRKCARQLQRVAACGRVEQLTVESSRLCPPVDDEWIASRAYRHHLSEAPGSAVEQQTLVEMDC
ncbi:hypothetical protein A5784_32660 [Mycobacterium sp. 852013-50091_SCH5140682]|nr:hypothetical protein A5784_32660 [Mycobacterium sp. 852013-50091_SCH5140682]